MIQTDPKKKIMFDRVIKIVNIVRLHKMVNNKVIASNLQMSEKMTNYYCTILKNSGILTSKRGVGGGYSLNDNIKVGHLFTALDMPMVKTGIKHIDEAFENYLNFKLIYK